MNFIKNGAVIDLFELFGDSRDSFYTLGIFCIFWRFSRFSLGLYTLGIFFHFHWTRLNIFLLLSPISYFIIGHTHSSLPLRVRYLSI
jgi:hypothetical protein